MKQSEFSAMQFSPVGLDEEHIRRYIREQDGANRKGLF
jgi:hypothetical protein